MIVQTLKFGSERFVVLPEKEYRELKALAKGRPGRKTRRLTVQDQSDVAEAKRRAKEPTRPYADLRKELGLT